MKKIILPAIGSALLVTLFVILGCANFSNNLFRAEQTVTGSAYTAYVGYTNGLASGTINPSVTESNAIKAARIQFAAGVLTVEGYRQAYATNSAVMSQAQAALDSLTASGSNLVYLINLVRAK